MRPARIAAAGRPQEPGALARGGLGPAERQGLTLRRLRAACSLGNRQAGRSVFTPDGNILHARRGAMKLTVVGCGDAFGSGGRLQTCYHVETAGNPLPHRLRRHGADRPQPARASIPTPSSTIFISHLHGDHFAGLVWWLIHAQHVAKRTAPLTVVGPAGRRGALRGGGRGAVSGLHGRPAPLRPALPGIDARDAARRGPGARHALRGGASLGRAVLCAALRGRGQGAELHRRHASGRRAWCRPAAAPISTSWSATSSRARPAFT